MKNILVLIALGIGFQGYSQDENEEINTVTLSACECLDEVDVSLARNLRYEKIESCISTSIMLEQVKTSLINPTKKVLDSSNGKTKKQIEDALNENKNITVVTDKNYKAIEEKLLRECDQMKTLMSNSEEVREASISEKQEARKFYDQGELLYGQEQFEEAIVSFKKAVKKDRNFAFAWDMIGISYRRLDEYKKAIKYYNKSLKIDPKGRMPLMNKPVAYEKLKDYQAAIESYQAFVDVYPDDPEGFYGLGRMYFNLDDMENALDNMMSAFTKYNAINSPYARDAEQTLSIFYQRLKEKDQIEIFERLAKKHDIQY